MVTNEQLQAGICALAVAIGGRDGKDWLRAVKVAMDDATPKAAAVESAEGLEREYKQALKGEVFATQAPEPCAGKGESVVVRNTHHGAAQMPPYPQQLSTPPTAAPVEPGAKHWREAFAKWITRMDPFCIDIPAAWDLIAKHASDLAINEKRS